MNSCLPGFKLRGVEKKVARRGHKVAAISKEVILGIGRGKPSLQRHMLFVFGNS
jgi:hypothetical protein